MNKDNPIYDYMRSWFDFSYENTDKINPNHAALYFYILSLANRLHWKPNFGLPTDITKEAIGMKSYKTYIKTLDDLITFGFINMIERSKNQYTANVVALVKNDKATTKALDKASIKASTEQMPKQVQSKDSIIKQINNTQINKSTIDERKLKFASTLQEFNQTYDRQMLKEFYEYWTEPNKSNTKFRQELEKTWSLSRRLETWSKNEKTKKINQGAAAQNQKPVYVAGRQTAEMLQKNLEIIRNAK